MESPLQNVSKEIARIQEFETEFEQLIPWKRRNYGNSGD
jgi:hypothetical protein